MEKIRLLIVDDYVVVCEGLRAMLSGEPGLEVVGEASGGAEAVALASEKKPNFLLMNLHLPDMDSWGAIGAIKEKLSPVWVIMLARSADDLSAIDAVRAGVSFLLLQDISRELLLQAVRLVSSGITLIPSDLLSQAVSSLATSRQGHQSPKADTQGLGALTPREREVLATVVKGTSNRGISHELGITEDTVKKHIQSIIAKLGASSRIDAAMKAARAGFPPLALPLSFPRK